MKITNTQSGPRGLNAVSGQLFINAGETVDNVEIYERERQHIEAAGWFQIEGDYTANPVTPGSSSVTLEDLQKQLAERDAELAALKAGDNDRDALKKQADGLGIEYARNISNEKLKELIDAKAAA